MRNSRLKSFFNFLLKLSLCLIPVALWYIYILLCPFYYMDSDFAYWQQQKDYVNQPHKAVDVVIIGDSTAMASIKPTKIKDFSITNIGLGGSSTIEVYYSLETYLKNSGKPKYVVCMFCPMNLTTDLGFFNKTLYYKYLSYSQVKEVSKVAESLGDEEYYGKEFEKTVRKYFLYSPEIYLSPVFNASFFGRKATNDKSYNETKKNCGYKIYGTASYNNKVKKFSKHFKCLPTVNYYFEKIIELCNEYNIEFIFDPPKFNEETFEYYQSTTIKDDYENYLLSLSVKYNNSNIHHTIESYTDDCFGDETHLNSSGADKYTEEFAQKMIALGV